MTLRVLILVSRAGLEPRHRIESPQFIDSLNGKNAEMDTSAEVKGKRVMPTKAFQGIEPRLALHAPAWYRYTLVCSGQPIPKTHSTD